MTLYHGTCVKFSGKGILIMGPSGAGKSDLAIRLIDAGAVLVSDDYVDVNIKDGKLVAAIAPNIAGLIEVRGVGLMKVDHLKSTPLHLVLDLVSAGKVDRLPEDLTFKHDNMEIPYFKFDAFAASAIIKIKMMLKL